MDAKLTAYAKVVHLFYPAVILTGDDSIQMYYLSNQVLLQDENCGAPRCKLNMQAP